MKADVRWRYNASGVEWFWNGHWYPLATPTQTTNLVSTINDVVATFQSPDQALDEALSRLLREAS